MVALAGPLRPPCYAEVKNVHLMRTPGLAEFPDSVTARGAKHLDELAAVAAAGARAVMLFLIQIGRRRQRTCVESMLFERLRHQRKFDNTIGHFNSGFAEFFGEHR